jgi:hypothetical protein
VPTAMPARPLERRPTVSVVVPCYRYGHYLPGAVASVLDQDDVDADVLIIDDCSPDDSGDVADAIAAADDRVRVIRHEQNMGHIATYNEGLGLVQGEYTVLLSADDLLTPGSLGRATALMEANPSVGFAYGHPLEFSDVPPPASTAVRSWSIWGGHEWIEQRCRQGDNCIFNPEVVMRGDVQRAIGGYDPTLPHSGDLEMWLRAAAISDVGWLNDVNQGYYRIHASSMQRTVHAGYLTDLEGRRDAFDSVLLGPSSRFTPETANRLSELARRAVATAALARATRSFDDGTTEEEPVDDYVAFALDAYPDARSLRAWRSLERRRRAGPERCHRGLQGSGRRLVRDLEGRVRWRRWRRSGV